MSYDEYFTFPEDIAKECLDCGAHYDPQEQEGWTCNYCGSGNIRTRRY